MSEIKAPVQEFLFEEFKDFSWKDEWIGMPEFIQEDLTPWRTMMVHFECQEDLDDFCTIIEQKATNLTKYMWHPRVESKKVVNKRWIDDK